MSTPATLMTSLITPAPRHIIEARDDGPLLGYFIDIVGTSTQTLVCDSSNVFTTSGDYCGCYNSNYVTSKSTLNNGCTGMTTAAGIQSGSLLTCTPDTVFWTCVTQTVFATFPNISPLTNYFCANAYSANTIYRDIPATALGTTLIVSPSQSTSLTSTVSFSTSITAPSANQSTTEPHKSSSSEAWISGPILSTVALIGFISLAIWFIRNRQRERSTLQDSRTPYTIQQEEQKRAMGMVGFGFSRNELP